MKTFTIEKDWPLKVTWYQVLLRKTIPLDATDKIILELLTVNGGLIAKEELGILLGFGIVDDPINNVYKDDAEIQLFEHLLQQLQVYHLISILKNEHTSVDVRLSYWGQYALDTGLKYAFYEAQAPVYDHLRLTYQEGGDTYFPFHKLAVDRSFHEIKKKREAYELEQEESEQSLFLKNKILSNQVEESGYILDFVQPEILNKFRKSVIVDIVLHNSLSEDNYIKVAFSGESLDELNILLRDADNKLIYDDLLVYAAYNALVAGGSPIQASKLSQYRSHVKWTEVLELDSLAWNDDLLQLLMEEGISSGEVWDKVARNAPEKLLLKNLDFPFQDYHSWLALTERLEPNFIFTNYEKYPWDTDIAIEKFSGLQLEALLEQGLLDDDFTDWNSLIAKLSDQFISVHLEYGKIALPALLRQKPDLSKGLIIEYPHLAWEWRYVSAHFELGHLLEHLDLLGGKLDLKIIIPRILNAADEVFEAFVNHTAFHGPLDRFVNDPKRQFYVNSETRVKLDKDRLAFLNKHQLSYWGEGQYAGIESNPQLIWTEELFALYHPNVKSAEGYEHVSRTIVDLNTIYENPNFLWNFSILSARKGLITEIRFIEQYKEQLAFAQLIYNVPKSLFIDEFSMFYQWAIKAEKTAKLRECLETRFALREMLLLLSWFRVETLNLSSSSPFNWYQIVNRTTESELTDALVTNQDILSEIPGSNQLVEHATRKTQWTFIQENLDLRWNWRIITEEKIPKEELQSSSFLDRYTQYLYWPYIVRGVLTEEELFVKNRLPEIATYLLFVPENIARATWAEITRKLPDRKLWYSIEDTIDNTIFKWDWGYISSSVRIQSRLSLDDLENYKEHIDWEKLSANSVLNILWQYRQDQYRNIQEWLQERLAYLESFQEKWDFRTLSAISAITWNYDIIDRFLESWDWETLSAHSQLFTRKDKNDQSLYRHGRLRKYASLISWPALSKRYDTWILPDLLSYFSDQEWDFEALSENPRLQLSIDLLTKTQEKKWNWQKLSHNESLPLNKDIVLARVKGDGDQFDVVDEWTWVAIKNWDWAYLSKAPWVDREVITQLSEKEWNWKVLSERKDLLFDQKMLELFLLKEGVNWRAVLKNNRTHVTPDTIELLEKAGLLFREDWIIISAHNNLNFHQVNDHGDLVFNWKFLEKYKESWDWQELVTNDKIDINDVVILRKFCDFIDWDQVSAHSSFDANIEVLDEFKDRLNWHILSAKLSLTEEILVRFKNLLDWVIVSQNASLPFTRALINQFHTYWAWHLLYENIAIAEDQQLYEYVLEQIDKNPLLQLILNLYEKGQSEAGYIYHYTHVANAIQILKEQKLASRSTAKAFNNSAGTVWRSNSRPHDYARFYFRPKTPNQFHNENLGLISQSREGLYLKWESMDYPKCVFPVFFKINLYGLQDLATQNFSLSNGSMQRSGTRYASINTMLPVFNFDDVFHVGSFEKQERNRIMNAREQEFLIQNGLDFKGIPKQYVQVLVPNAQIKTLLEESGIPERFKKVIEVNPSVFNNENSSVNLQEDDEEIQVTVPSKDYFSLRVFCPTAQSSEDNLPKGRVKQAPTQLGNYQLFEFYHEVTIPKATTFTITLYDDQPIKDSNNKQDWLIYTTDKHWEEVLTTFGKTYKRAP